MESAGHAEELDQRQAPAMAPAAAAMASAPPGLTSEPARTALFLQRHAGNRAVARLVTGRSGRLLARQPEDTLVQDQALEDLLGETRESAVEQSGEDVEALDTKTEDRYDKIAGAGGSEVLKKINPSAPAFTKYPCTQNCPKAATDAQAYLNTGAFPSSTCSPLNEPKGYAISPGPDSWGTAAGWTTTWTAIKKALPSHGSCVIVEGDRGKDGPKDLTQWHYFVVANVRGKWIVVDAYLGEIATDVDAYVKALKTKTYTFTSQTVNATGVR
jgi:hypothetical protein